jgi:hypothetical protein
VLSIVDFGTYPLKDWEFHMWNLGFLGRVLRFQFTSGFFETFLVDGEF